MEKLEGRASGKFAPVIGRVTTSGVPFYARAGLVRVCSRLGLDCLGYRGCITSGKRGWAIHPEHVYGVDGIDKLREGDIVQLFDDGRILVQWENGSSQNCFFLTEACNCNCLMCPQPPKEHNPAHLRDAHRILSLLKDQKIGSICLTGGEPTLLGEKFVRFLARCVAEHPEAEIEILTNGKCFADAGFTREVAAVATKSVCFCVSLHSDLDTVHDRMVGRPGSYAKTQKGIYRLAEHGCPIEIRHVITRINFQRLKDFADHMHNYFPFCVHYAFMGLELCGHASENREEVDINPLEYVNYLQYAMRWMHRYHLNTSIYNLPLCVLPKDIRKNAARSISLWKNIYLPKCNDCVEKAACAGFFSTSVSLPESSIQPIFSEEI